MKLDLILPIASLLVFTTLENFDEILKFSEKVRATRGDT